MRQNRLVKDGECRLALLDAGGKHRPDPHTPAPFSFAPSALGNLAIDGDETHALLHGVVRRFNARHRGEGEVKLAVIAESLGKVWASVRRGARFAPWSTASAARAHRSEGI